MIEFTGQLSSVVEKRILYKQRTFEAKGIAISFLMMFPGMTVFLIKIGLWQMALALGFMLVTFPLLALIVPRSKKEIEQFTPKSMIIDNECIMCKKVNTADVRYFEDIKTIKDFGEFYEFGFRFGKISTHFICQKDLLVKGTLEEFESLFEGKIVRVEKT